MKAGWLVPAWLVAGASAWAFQGAASTAPATGVIEGQIFSASTGGPLKKATVRLTAVQQPGGRGMAMGGRGATTQPGQQGQAQVTPTGQVQQQGGRGGGQAAAAGAQAQQTQAQQVQAQLQQQMQTMLGGVQTAVSSFSASNASRTTDETGRFTFTGLAAGEYRISVKRQGYLDQSYGARKYNTSGTPIALKDGQKVSNLVIRMNPQAVIVGKVLDEDGDPVVGLEVRAMKSVYRNGKKTWAMENSAETNDIGVYRIPELDPGRYILATVSQNGGRGPMGGGRGGQVNEPLPQTPDSIYAATYFPDGLDVSSAVPLDLTAGSEMSGIDIHLRKTRVFRIRGKVANVPATTSGGGGGGRGGAMGGPSVMVNLVSPEGTGRGPGSAARPPDYTFEIRGVTPGSYTLLATTNGGGPGGGPGGRGGSTGGMSGMMAMQHVNVGSNHLEGLVLQLAVGAEIQGTIKVEGASTPVSMPNVNVALRSTMAQAGGAPRARVADDSKFTLTGVSPLPYTVQVSGVPDNCYIKSIRYGGQEVPEDGMNMGAGGAMEITLSATAGTIAATVSDSSGNPMQNVTVALYLKGGPVTAAKSASSNESGAVTFKGLKPADYRLIAWEDIPSGAYLDPVFVQLYESRGETVTVNESGQASVQLKVITAAETDQ